MKRQSTKSSEPPTETEGAAFHLFFSSRKEGGRLEQQRHPALRASTAPPPGEEPSSLPPQTPQIYPAPVFDFSLMIHCPRHVGEAEASVFASRQREKPQIKSRKNGRTLWGGIKAFSVLSDANATHKSTQLEILFLLSFSNGSSLIPNKINRWRWGG